MSAIRRSSGLGERPLDNGTPLPQLADPTSTLHLVRTLIGLRTAHFALGSRAETTVLHGGYPFAYLRGDSHVVVVNPRREPASFDLSGITLQETLLTHCATVAAGRVEASGFGYGIFTVVPE